MKILFINQVYPPDPAATGQQQAALAKALVKEGHEVTVITSSRGYDNPAIRYPTREETHGIKILRVWRTGFGKGAKWKRAIDFATYAVSCAWRSIRLPRHHAVVTLTTPPLISILGAILAALWRARYTYWVMDLNPDEAIAAGWLKERGITARILEAISRFSLRRADAVIALDHFMAQRIAQKNITKEKIHVLPPWAHNNHVNYDKAGRETFRKEHGLENAFIVMYSGNHSPCHPLDTVLQAALALREEPDLIFCFIGGGTEYQKVKIFREKHRLEATIRCLSYQPLECLSASLSAADLHLVVMGEPFVGTIHPCKIYNILSLGIPCLCVTPEESHLVELSKQIDDPRSMRAVRHHDKQAMIAAILDFKAIGKGRREQALCDLALQYSENRLIPLHAKLIQGLAS